MRKYTRKCEFPRAEIHAEMCITACGNTLNQVQKNSSIATLMLNLNLDICFTYCMKIQLTNLLAVTDFINIPFYDKILHCTLTDYNWIVQCTLAAPYFQSITKHCTYPYQPISTLKLMKILLFLSFIWMEIMYTYDLQIQICGHSKGGNI